MSKVAASILLSASTIINPAVPKALSFDASAYVTLKKEIRVSVAKSANIPVTVLLRDQNNQVIYSQRLSMKDDKCALKLNVDQLTDGQYELEIKSNEGSIRKQLNLSTQPVQQTSRVIAVQ